MRYLKFKKWPIIAKIMAISVISITCILCMILFYFLPLIENRVEVARRNEIRNLVSMAYNILEEHEAEARDQPDRREALKERAAERVKRLRFGENNYFWINDLDYKMVMHPVKPHLNGVDQSTFQDPSGKFVFKEFVDVSRRTGSGFVEYLWPRPGATIPVRKVAFVRLYEPWGWIVGGGVYVDDIEKDLRQLRAMLMFGVGLFAIGTLSIAWAIGADITRPLQKVMNGLEEVARGQTGIVLSKRLDVTAIDEIGLLTAKFNDLMESLHQLSLFKKVIEEDASLEQVYMRLHWVFTETMGIEDCVIYEVVANGNGMHPIYPAGMDEADLFCHPEILNDCDLCKAKRTGHVVDSTTFPMICTLFQNPKQDKVHHCFPVTVSGGVVGVIMLRMQKPIDPTVAAIAYAKVRKAEHYINESLSVIETKRLMSNLRESSLRDPLTGLHNRRYLQESVENMVASMMRRKKSIGVILCDVDHFKHVNDTHGHQAGDIVLKDVANIIRKSIRESDVVIRFGGEEFLAILLDMDGGEAFEVAEKIRRNVEAATFKIPDGSLKKTISLGVSEFPGDSGTLWQCIQFADGALYQSKGRGRNQTVRFVPATEEISTLSNSSVGDLPA